MGSEKEVICDHPDLVKNKCTNHGQLHVVLEHGFYNKTHPDLIENECTNFGELSVITQTGAHNPDNMH